MPNSSNKDVLLIDAKNYCWRHGFTRRNLRTTRKLPTGVLYGVLAGMLRLNRHFPDAAMVFCWDGHDTDNSWRHKLASTYKANRRQKVYSDDSTQVRKDIYMQIPVLQKILDDLGFRQFCIPQLEADDLIGILSRKLKKKAYRVLIYSSDKDFFQLMSDNVFVVRDIDKSLKLKPLSPNEVLDQFGVSHDKWTRVQAIVGESTDHIAHPIKGVGRKTAIKFLEAGCDPSKRTCTIEKLEAHWELIRLNYKLSKIIRRVDDKRLPSDVAKQIQTDVLDHVSSDLRSLFRSKKGRSNEAYRKLIDALRKHELEVLLEARQKLFKLP